MTLNTLMQPISVDSLLRRASDLSGIPVHILYGPSHKRDVCAVRAAVYQVAHMTHSIPLAQIGRRVGRHHTTIMNALDQDRLYRSCYPQYDVLVDALRNGNDSVCWFRAPPKPKAIKPKRPIRFYTEEEFLQVDRMVHSGMMLVDIADRLGRTYDSLKSARRDWLKKNPHRKVVRVRRVVDRKRVCRIRSDAEIANAVRLRRMGFMWREVKEMTGIPPATVIYRMKSQASRRSGRCQDGRCGTVR